MYLLGAAYAPRTANPHSQRPRPGVFISDREGKRKDEVNRLNAFSLLPLATNHCGFGPFIHLGPLDRRKNVYKNMKPDRTVLQTTTRPFKCWDLQEGGGFPEPSLPPQKKQYVHSWITVAKTPLGLRRSLRPVARAQRCGYTHLAGRPVGGLGYRAYGAPEKWVAANQKKAKHDEVFLGLRFFGVGAPCLWEEENTQGSRVTVRSRNGRTLWAPQGGT